MQVILLQDVPKVGRKYEAVEVANGYAQNYLFPQKLAETARPDRLKQLAAKKQEADAQHQAQYEALKKVFAEIHGTSFIMHAKANEQGHLFQGIKVDDIATFLSEKTGNTIHAEEIDRQEPIKDLGAHELTIEHDDLKATVSVVVEKEG
jgi:large subunit ribosomal protein L9